MADKISNGKNQKIFFSDPAAHRIVVSKIMSGMQDKIDSASVT
jgi:hypothetical protein